MTVSSPKMNVIQNQSFHFLQVGDNGGESSNRSTQKNFIPRTIPTKPPAIINRVLNIL